MNVVLFELRNLREQLAEFQQNPQGMNKLYELFIINFIYLFFIFIHIFFQLIMSGRMMKMNQREQQEEMKE